MHISSRNVHINLATGIRSVRFPCQEHIYRAPYKHLGQSGSNLKLPVLGKELALKVDIRSLAVQSTNLNGKFASAQQSLRLAVSCH